MSKRKKKYIVIPISQDDLEALLNVIGVADEANVEWINSCGECEESVKEAKEIERVGKLFSLLKKSFVKQTSND